MLGESSHEYTLLLPPFGCDWRSTLLLPCRISVPCFPWSSADRPAGDVPATGCGCGLCLRLAVGHHPPQLRGLVCCGLEGGLLLPWHQLAAAQCAECADPPHRLLWSHSLGSLLQSGVPLVPHLYSLMLLRLVTGRPAGVFTLALPLSIVLPCMCYRLSFCVRFSMSFCNKTALSISFHIFHLVGCSASCPCEVLRSQHTSWIMLCGQTRSLAPHMFLYLYCRWHDSSQATHHYLPHTDKPDPPPCAPSPLGQPSLRAVCSCWAAAFWHHLCGALLCHDINLAGKLKLVWPIHSSCSSLLLLSSADLDYIHC